MRQKLNSWQPPSSAPGIHVVKPVISWQEKGRKESSCQQSVQGKENPDFNLHCLVTIPALRQGFGSKPQAHIWSWECLRWLADVLSNVLATPAVALEPCVLASAFSLVHFSVVERGYLLLRVSSSSIHIFIQALRTGDDTSASPIGVETTPKAAVYWLWVFISIGVDYDFRQCDRFSRFTSSNLTT